MGTILLFQYTFKSCCKDRIVVVFLQRRMKFYWDKKIHCTVSFYPSFILSKTNFFNYILWTYLQLFQMQFAIEAVFLRENIILYYLFVRIVRFFGKWYDDYIGSLLEKDCQWKTPVNEICFSLTGAIIPMLIRHIFGLLCLTIHIKHGIHIWLWKLRNLVIAFFILIKRKLKGHFNAVWYGIL